MCTVYLSVYNIMHVFAHIIIIIMSKRLSHNGVSVFRRTHTPSHQQTFQITLYLFVYIFFLMTARDRCPYLMSAADRIRSRV